MVADLLDLAEAHKITTLDHEGHMIIPLRNMFKRRTASMVLGFNRLHGTSVSLAAAAAKYKRVRNPEWARMKNNIQKEKYKQARLNKSGFLYTLRDPDNPVEVTPEAPSTPNKSGVSIAVIRLSRLLSENKIDEATFDEALAQF